MGRYAIRGQSKSVGGLIAAPQAGVHIGSGAGVSAGVYLGPGVFAQASAQYGAATSALDDDRWNKTDAPARRLPRNG